MRTSVLLVAVLLIAPVLTGCLGDQGPDGVGPSQDQAREAPDQPAEHGEPSIEEGPVEVYQDDGGWVAEQVVNVTNDLAGAETVTHRVRVPAGALEHGHPGAGTGDDRGPGYAITVVLKARAETEEQARQGLESMRLVHEDEKSGTTIDLVTEVRLPQDDPAGADPGTVLGETSFRTAQVSTVFPRGPLYELDVATSAGGISVAGAFPTVTARTSAGGVNLEVIPWTSGTIDASADAGGVTIGLDGGSSNGYDVTGQAQAGGVTISIPDGEPVGEQSRNNKHVRTSGFDSKDIQTTVAAETQAGGVTVQAS